MAAHVRAGLNSREGRRPALTLTRIAAGWRSRNPASAATANTSASDDHDPAAARPISSGPIHQIHAPCSEGRKICLRSRVSLAARPRPRGVRV